MDIYVYMALIGLAAGLVKGVSGFGSSLVTIPLLTMVFGVDRLEEIIVIMITFNVVLNILLMKENKAFKMEHLQNIKLIVIPGAIFTVIGLLGLKNLNGDYINYIAASLILLAILVTSYNLFVKNKVQLQPRPIYQIIAGVFSGIGNGIASIDGPPVVFYLTATNTTKESFKGTLATHFLVMGIIGVISMIALNLYTIDILINGLFILIFTIIGLLSGMRISRNLNEQTFKIVTLAILLALDIKMFFF